MTQEELLSVAEIIERLVKRFEEQGAEHARKMAEHRASFGARTEADRLIIEGLRAIVKEQSDHAKDAGTLLGWAPNESAFQAAQRVVKERDGLLAQVQDQRAEIERLQWENQTMHKDAEDGYAEAIKVLGDPIALSKERDALRAEVADLRGIVDMVHASLGIKQGDHIGNAIAVLKAHTLKRSHPVAVGGYLRRLTGFGTTPAGEVAQVLHVHVDEYTIKRPNGQPGVWSENGCEPCDPPADHDTPAGKEAAESVIRDFRSGDSEVSITGLFDDTKITVRREPDQDHGSRIVIRDANDMGEANIYLTESGARQMATALIGLCDVRKVPQ